MSIVFWEVTTAQLDAILRAIFEKNGIESRDDFLAKLGTSNLITLVNREVERQGQKLGKISEYPTPEKIRSRYQKMLPGYGIPRSSPALPKEGAPAPKAMTVRMRVQVSTEEYESDSGEETESAPAPSGPTLESFMAMGMDKDVAQAALDAMVAKQKELSDAEKYEKLKVKHGITKKEALIKEKQKEIEALQAEIAKTLEHDDFKAVAPKAKAHSSKHSVSSLTGDYVV